MRQKLAAILILGAILAPPAILFSTLLHEKLAIAHDSWIGAILTIAGLVGALFCFYLIIFLVSRILTIRGGNEQPIIYPLLALAQEKEGFAAITRRAPYCRAPQLSKEEHQALSHLWKELRHSSFAIQLPFDQYPGACEALLREIGLANANSPNAAKIAFHGKRMTLTLNLATVKSPESLLTRRNSGMALQTLPKEAAESPMALSMV